MTRPLSVKSNENDVSSAIDENYANYGNGALRLHSSLQILKGAGQEPPRLAIRLERTPMLETPGYEILVAEWNRAPLQRTLVTLQDPPLQPPAFA